MDRTGISGENQNPSHTEGPAGKAKGASRKSDPGLRDAVYLAAKHPVSIGSGVVAATMGIGKLAADKVKPMYTEELVSEMLEDGEAGSETPAGDSLEIFANALENSSTEGMPGQMGEERSLYEMLDPKMSDAQGVLCEHPEIVDHALHAAYEVGPSLG